MYDLSTLGRKWSDAKLSTRRFKKYRNWGYNAIPGFQTKPFTQVNSASPSDGVVNPYSKELMDLVKRCMKPRKAERPTVQELRSETRAQLKRCINDVVVESEAEKDTDDESAQNAELQLLDDLKVYFKENQINHMDSGSEDFKYCSGNIIIDGVELTHVKDDVNSLLDANMDPDWDQLRLPSYLNDRVEASRKEKAKKSSNRYWRDQCRTTGDKIEFKDPPTNVAKKYKSLVQQEKGAPGHIFGGSETEDSATGDNSTTSESEGELKRKLERKRKRKAPAGLSETALHQSIPPASPAAVGNRTQDATQSALATTTEGREIPTVHPQSTTVAVAGSNTAQSVPTLGPAPALAADRSNPTQQRPQRRQPSRQAKKQKTQQ